MGRTIARQETQIRQSDLYNDAVVPSLANFETNPVSIEDDLNNLRSASKRHLQGTGAGNWWDDLVTPSALEAGTQRGINSLNDALHLLEKKRFLRRVVSLVDVVVSAGQNFEILLLGELPSNTTIAVGTGTALGTVASDLSGAFGAASLVEVAGDTAINPQNLVDVVDGATRDPILSSGRVVRALLQSENAGPTFTATGTTPNRLQVSFVRINAAGDDIEACPVSDIENRTVNLTFRERVRFESLTQQDLLSDSSVDVPAGSTVTRQVGYDNQGVTPVELANNAFLDLAAGIAWRIRDLANANLFSLVEGSGGGTTAMAVGSDVDTYTNDAQLVDFDKGVRANTGGTRPIHVGVADGILETTAGDLQVRAFAELLVSDGNRAGSTFSTPLKVTDTSAEWDALEVEFGEVSLASMLVQAKRSAHYRRVFAVVTVAANENVDVSGPSNDNNLDADLGNLSAGVFTSDYDLYVNGSYQRPGANAAANHDYYPGTSLANGQLRFEFKLKVGDQIALVDRAFGP